MSVGRFLLRLCSWFKGHPWPLAAVIAGLLLEMGFNALVPVAFQHLIDDALTPRDAGVLLKLLGALALGTLLIAAVGLAVDRLYASLAARVVAGIRLRLFTHLQTLSGRFFQTYSTAELNTRYATDIAKIENVLATWMAWAIKPTLDLLGYTIILFTIDWRLACLAQLIWPLSLLGPRLIAPRATATSFERKTDEARVLESANEALGGRHVVRAFGLETMLLNAFAERVARLATTSTHSAWLGSALERSSAIGTLGMQILILGCGAWLAFEGDLSIGALVAFHTVFTALSAAIGYLAQYTPSLIEAITSLQRIEEVFAHRPTLRDAPDALTLPPFERSLTVENVVYAPEPGRRVLDQVSLHIAQGESVALVGASGSGKSTLLHLLMRTFDPDTGRVRIDDHDLRSVTRDSFYRQTAVVFQDSFLFAQTLRENIRLGRLDASDADVEQAARLAEIHDVIVALPHGYATLVGGSSSTLSGGQRQRVAIARALLRDPRILFLDEATSALDPGTEAALNQTLTRLSLGRTVISVTHRLASVVNLNRIYVLDAGRLVEAGPHAELVARGGLYAQLWRKQDGFHTTDDGSHADVTPARLREIPLLASLDETFLASLARERFITETLPAQRLIFQEGDPGDKFYLIVRGSVQVSRRSPSGMDQHIAVLQDGDNFGERALLSGEPRNATLRTLTPVILLVLTRQHFLTLVDQSSGVREILRQQEATRSQTPFSGAPTPRDSSLF